MKCFFLLSQLKAGETLSTIPELLFVFLEFLKWRANLIMFLWPYFLCSSSGKVFENFHFIFFSNTDFWPCFDARKLPLLNTKQLQSHRFSLFLIGTTGFPPVVSSSGAGEH